MKSITRNRLVGVLAVTPFLIGSGATAANAVAAPIRIMNVRSELCMEINQADGTSGFGDGTGLLQYTCHTGDQQKWTLWAEELDSFGNVLSVSFINGRSGKCLEPNQADGTSGKGIGTRIVQYTCHHGVQQRWQQIPMGDGSFQFKNKRSELCMEVNQADGTSGFGNGTVVLQYRCHGGEQQRWAAA